MNRSSPACPAHAPARRQKPRNTRPPVAPGNPPRPERPRGIDLRARQLQGAEIRIRGPRNHFQLAPSPNYLFIAGGIGITPILAMIAEAEARGREMEAVYGGRSRRRWPSSMSWPVTATGSRLAAGPAGAARPGAHPRAPRRRTPSSTAAARRGCSPRSKSAAPPGRAGALHSSGSAPAHTETGADEPIEVELPARSDVDRPADRSVLEVVEQPGVGVLSSCQGTCGTCETPVLDGMPEHRDDVLAHEERDATTA